MSKIIQTASGKAISKGAKQIGGKILPKIAGEAGKALASNLNPLEVLKEYFVFKKAEEEEITERQRIRAKRDMAVAAIQAQRELIEKYFEYRFAERSTTLAELFKLLDHAVQNRSENELDAALQGILGVVKDSPLKDFESFTSARLQGKEIEI